MDYRELWRKEETLTPKYCVRSRALYFLYFLSKKLGNCLFGHYFGIVTSVVEITDRTISFT